MKSTHPSSKSTLFFVKYDREVELSEIFSHLLEFNQNLHSHPICRITNNLLHPPTLLTNLSYDEMMNKTWQKIHENLY